MIQKVFAVMLMAFAFLDAKASAVSRRLGEEFLKTIEAADEDIALQTRATARGMNSRGQLGLGTILAAFTVVIASMVVLLVVDTFDQSLGTPSSSALSSSQDSILSGFANMTELIGPLLLIAIGVVIIGLIRRVQTQ